LTQGGAETSESRNLPSNLLDAAKARKQAWLGGKADV